MLYSFFKVLSHCNACKVENQRKLNLNSAIPNNKFCNLFWISTYQSDHLLCTLQKRLQKSLPAQREKHVTVIKNCFSDQISNPVLLHQQFSKDLGTSSTEYKCKGLFMLQWLYNPIQRVYIIKKNAIHSIIILCNNTITVRKHQQDILVPNLTS